jgi:hypothetical protein
VIAIGSHYLGIGLATVAVGLDIETLFVGVPGTDERGQSW